MESTGNDEQLNGSLAADVLRWIAGLLGLVGRYRGPVALIVVFVVGILVAGETSEGDPVFLTGATHVNVLFEYAEYGILAAGMTLVILTAGIDLSVGSVLGLSSVTFALLTLGYGWSAWMACLAAVALGGACGMVSGLLVSRAKFQPFVATLAMMVVARGLAKQVSGHMKVAPGAQEWYHVMKRAEMPDLFRTITSPLAETRPPLWCWYIPVAVIALSLFMRYVPVGRTLDAALLGPANPRGITRRSVITVLAWVVTLGLPAALLAPHLQVASYLFLGSILVMALIVKFTRFGRHLYAIGGNEEAARLSGVPVLRSKTIAYVLCGLLSGLAGIISACRLSMGDPEAGATFELDAIAAVVIGGTSLMGGRGAVTLTLVGALLMGYANKILSNVQLPTVVNAALYAGLFILIVTAFSPGWLRLKGVVQRAWARLEDRDAPTRVVGGSVGLLAIVALAGIASAIAARPLLALIEVEPGFLQDGAKLLAKGLIIVLAVVVQETRRRRA